MKVVHIGDSDSGGGAAHAMSRLHEALQRLGVDSNLLVRNGSSPAKALETIATRGDTDDLFPAERDAVVRQYVELNRTSLSNTHFSLYINGADLSRGPLVASSDIVHLHWTASFQTPADVRALLDAKPVVWTLHDLEPLTGGCHFTAGCDGYAGDCASCPQLVRDPFHVTATALRDKKTFWAGSRPTFVAPSRYIAERARRSAVAHHAEASIVYIPHGIDVAVFRPQPKADARRALGVPADGLYVLCGSNYNAEKRKGLDMLDRVLAAAKADARTDSSKLTLLTVGEPKLGLHDLDGIGVVQLGRVAADVMPSVYAAADVFLYPSVEDNFPCMLLESLSCGTPAIAFDIGGIADIVHDETCGRLIPAGDELAMAAALSSLLRDRERLRRMGELARAHIEEHFTDRLIARKHAELYDDVLANRSAPRPPSGALPKSELAEIFPRWSSACLIQELAFARERASMLAEGSRANSARIAALERETAALASNLAVQTRQVHEKEAELNAVHEVAEDRKRLAEELHASAASIEAVAVTLQKEVRDRDDLLAKLEATSGEQRAEIELVHRVAADRRQLIEDLHRVVEERHASAAGSEAFAVSLQREIRERDDLRVKLEATIDEQRAEIELVHHVAADRRQLIEDLHRTAEERLQEKEAELIALHEVAEERKRLAERLHASAASIEALAASLQREVRERDGRLAKHEATIGEQHAEIELVHHIAADRLLLIDDLHRVAEERAAVIDQLSALADAPQPGVMP